MATETMTITEAPIIDATTVEITEEQKENEVNTAVQHLNMSTDVGMNRLTPKEKEECKALATTIKTNDISSVMNYGCEAQKALNTYSNAFLESNRTSMAGELGGLIDDLFSELDEIDYNELSAPNGLVRVARQIPIIRHLVKSITKIMHKYDNIAKNVDNIAKRIEVGRMGSLRENNALQVMFDKNVEYIKSSDKLIFAANEKLKEVTAELEKMIANKDNYESYEISDMDTFKGMLERKITDLITVRYAMKQTLPQIRTVQQNNLILANKAQTAISTTLPLWKNALSLAVSLQNQKNFKNALNKVDETTNRLLKLNADTLAENSIDIAKANQRGIIELETLRHTTTRIIDMMKEVKQINAEASAKRSEMIREIEKMNIETEATIQSIEKSVGTFGDTLKQLEYNS